MRPPDEGSGWIRWSDSEDGMKLRLSLSIFATVLVVGAADLMGQEHIGD
jgi:hypothetical protein